MTLLCRFALSPLSTTWSCVYSLLFSFQRGDFTRRTHPTCHEPPTLQVCFKASFDDLELGLPSSFQLPKGRLYEGNTSDVTRTPRVITPKPNSGGQPFPTQPGRAVHMSPVPDSPPLRSRLTPALFPTRTPPVLNTRVPNTPQLQPTRLTFQYLISWAEDNRKPREWQEGCRGSLPCSLRGTKMWTSLRSGIASKGRSAHAISLWHGNAKGLMGGDQSVPIKLLHRTRKQPRYQWAAHNCWRSCVFVVKWCSQSLCQDINARPLSGLGW